MYVVNTLTAHNVVILAMMTTKNMGIKCVVTGKNTMFVALLVHFYMS